MFFYIYGRNCNWAYKVGWWQRGCVWAWQNQAMTGCSTCVVPPPSRVPTPHSITATTANTASAVITKNWKKTNTARKFHFHFPGCWLWLFSVLGTQDYVRTGAPTLAMYFLAVCQTSMQIYCLRWQVVVSSWQWPWPRTFDSRNSVSRMQIRDTLVNSSTKFEVIRPSVFSVWHIFTFICRNQMTCWMVLCQHNFSTNQHPAVYRPDALPVAQPTASKHWRESGKKTG